MDEVYPPNKFVCSENISLKEYFNKFSAILELDKTPDCTNKDEILLNNSILNRMRVENRLEHYNVGTNCSIDLLTVEGEASLKKLEGVKSKFKMPKVAKNLKTIKVQTLHRDKLLKLHSKRNYDLQDTLDTIKPVDDKQRDIKPGSKFAVCIRVYHPFEFRFTQDNSYRHLKFSHEIIVLSTDTLADFRDKLLCIRDFGLCKEIEDPTVNLVHGDSKVKYPSGFIFIDNTFFNDVRPNCNVDYSDVIIRWARNRGIQPLNTAAMHTTHIEDLKPRFGYPYVYQHQGNCEHILAFSDAWLVDYSNPSSSQLYPYYQAVHHMYGKFCNICYVTTACWICVDCKRLPLDTFAICHDCLISYCYKDGKKIGSFKVYPLFDKKYTL